MKDKTVFWILIIITCATYFVAGFSVGNDFPDKRYYTDTVYIEKSFDDYKELNPENVMFWLNFFEVEYPEIVLTQSIQECGWNLDSQRATEDNNIFGLQHSNENSFEYAHWIGSIIRYKKFQSDYYKGGDYYKFLQDCNYAEDPNYTSKLKQINFMLHE